MAMHHVQESATDIAWNFFQRVASPSFHGAKNSLPVRGASAKPDRYYTGAKNEAHVKSFVQLDAVLP